MGNNQLERRVLADLHMHTAYEDPFFSGRKLKKIVQKSLRSGLSAIAITDHDRLFTNNRAIEEARVLGLLVISGIEITSCAKSDKKKNHPHILGIGLTNIKDFVPTGRTPVEVARWIKDQGALVVAPHLREKGDKHRMSFRQLSDLYELGLVDAVEVMDLYGTNYELLRYIQTWSIAMLGASDAHWLEHIGCVATEIRLQTPGVPSQQDAINAIQDKNNRPTPVKIKEYPEWKKKAAKIAEQIIYRW